MSGRVAVATSAMVIWSLLIGCDQVESTGVDQRCPQPELVDRFALTGAPALCEGCNTNCFLTYDAPDDGDLTVGDRIRGEGVTFDGTYDGIVINGRGAATSSSYGWVASNASLSDTVTKVNLSSRTTAGVYRIGLSSNEMGANQPSQVAVDQSGHAFVAARCFECQGVVAKISALPDLCIDLNANGELETSTGLGDIRGWWSAPDQDECLLWQVPVGDNDGQPLALTIDASGRLWVGLHTERRYAILDPDDGAELGSLEVDHHPVGAAISPEGILWSLGRQVQGAIQPIDTNADPPDTAAVGLLSPLPGTALGYGIAIDELGRVFVADSTGGLLRYRPDALDVLEGIGIWDSLDVTWSTSSRGVTLTYDGAVYLTHPNVDSVTVHNADSLEILDTFDIGTEGASRPWSLCPDGDGLIWTANSGSPNLSVIDPEVGVVDTVTTEDNNNTQGDFTGYGLMTFVNEIGNLYRTYGPLEGCDVGVPSQRFRVFYRLGFLEGGQILFFGRSANTRDGLATAREVLLGATSASRGFIEVADVMSAAGESPSRNWFQLRVRLDRGSRSPVVREIVLEEHCQP